MNDYRNADLLSGAVPVQSASSISRLRYIC